MRSSTLVLGRVERYIVEQRSDGVALKMRQGRNGIAVMAISLGVLAVSWWFSVYGPRPSAAFGGDRPATFYWIWSGFFAVTAVMSLVAAFYRQNWVITGTDIIASTSVGPWRGRTHRMPTGDRLVVWREFIGDEDRMFRYCIHFMDAGQHTSTFCIEFQSSGSVDRFLDLLRPVLTMDVVEQRPS